jgi:ABC-type nitrate/sulfonate/bicarbonate transport system permease component
VRSRLVTDVLVAAAALAAVAVGLELWVRAAEVPEYLFPAPSAVLARLAEDPSFFALEAAVTVVEATFGFALGVTAAFGVGALMAHSRVLERFLYPLAVLVKLTPIVAVAPLFTLWFGFGAPPKIAIAALITFFPMVVNAFVGLRDVDPSELAFLQVLDASRWEIFRALRVPSSLPYLFSGARISANLALIGAVVAEWTGADRGLGRVILVANANLDLATLFGAVLVLVVIGVAVNVLASTVEGRVLHWHPTGMQTA